MSRKAGRYLFVFAAAGEPFSKTRFLLCLNRNIYELNKGVEIVSERIDPFTVNKVEYLLNGYIAFVGHICVWQVC